MESITEIQAPFEVSPFSMEICENRFTDTNTVWWKDEVYWRQAVDEEITGTCDGGISFECTSQSRTSARDTATLTGICRFTFPDGSMIQKVFHRTYANGDGRREFTKWK